MIIDTCAIVVFVRAGEVCFRGAGSGVRGKERASGLARGTDLAHGTTEYRVRYGLAGRASPK